MGTSVRDWPDAVWADEHYVDGHHWAIEYTDGDGETSCLMDVPDGEALACEIAHRWTCFTDLRAALWGAVQECGHAADCASREHTAAECTCWRGDAVAALARADENED